MPARILFWGDIACPWASLAVHRLRATRTALGLDGDVVIEHRPFALELVNARPTPKRTVDAEIAEISRHEPALGWRPWSRPDSQWPGTVLLALEAVQAAREQGAAASEDLDAALRSAFYRDSRPIGLLTEVLAVAHEVGSLDAALLDSRLAVGAGRAEVVEGWRTYEQRGVKGSPHLFLPDGTGVHNPGVRLGKDEHGHPVIEGDDPAVYAQLLRRATGGS